MPAVANVLFASEVEPTLPSGPLLRLLAIVPRRENRCAERVLFPVAIEAAFGRHDVSDVAGFRDGRIATQGQRDDVRIA